MIEPMIASLVGIMNAATVSIDSHHASPIADAWSVHVQISAYLQQWKLRVAMQLAS